MTEILTNINIFVSSPRDVRKERECLESVIESLNRMLGLSLKVNLHLLRWEKDVAPGAGGEVQDVIERQIGNFEEIDIFIGIMHTRYGSPTKGYPSGTISEFEQAHKVWQKKNGPELLMYFNSEPPVIAQPEDAIQYADVLKFKQQLTKKGVLFYDYKGADEFEEASREHLFKTVNKLVSDSPIKTDLEGVTISGLQAVEDFSNLPTSSTCMLFVYGSLLNPQSFLQSISRKSQVVEYVPASLHRYQRKWGIPYKKKNMIDNNWQSIDDIYWQSVLIKQTGRHADSVPGAITWVYDFELETLIDREFHYELIDVTDFIHMTSGKELKDQALTFCPKDDNKQLSSKARIAVRQGYFEMIQASLIALGFNEELEKPDHGNIVEAQESDMAVEQIWRLNNSEIPRLETSLLNFVGDRKALRLVGKRHLPIRTCVRPVILNSTIYSEIKLVAECTLSILTKALKLMIKDSALRGLSGFRDIDFENAEMDISNNTIFPQIGRVDLTFSQSRLGVFEANCDSPGGMFHLDLLTNKQPFLCQSIGLDKIDFDAQGLTSDALVDTLHNSWTDYCERALKQKRVLKNIAIVERDWKQWTTKSEFEFFKEKISTKQTRTFICEPNELLLKKDGLYYEDKRIDLVYKRVLWKDLVDPSNKRIMEAEHALLDAYRDQIVCVVNSFGCRMVGNKILQALILESDFEERLEEAGISLTENEKRVITENMPYTRIWASNDSALVDRVLSSPENYVVKSFLGYGAKEVLIGDQIERPANAFSALLDKGYIVQEKIRHGTIGVPVCEDDDVKWESHFFILGAYLMGGKCIAIEAKVNTKIPISMNSGASRTGVFPTYDTR